MVSADVAQKTGPQLSETIIHWGDSSEMGCDVTSGLFRFCMICLSESKLAKNLVQPLFRYCQREESIETLTRKTKRLINDNQRLH